jgi:hemerythrin-like domain-containing protein
MLDVVRPVRAFRPTPTPEAIRADPLGYLAEDHRAQRALADLLEELADALPDGVTRAGAARAAAMLRGPARRDAALEEQALFPVIEARADGDATARRMIALAVREHGEAAGRAIELAEELDEIARLGFPRNPESLGLMLRAFFEGARRHLDWVDAAIVSPARRALAPPDLADLGARLARLAASPDLPAWTPLAVIEGGASR